MYDKLFSNFIAFDTGWFAWKAQCNANKSGLEKKIDDPSRKIPNTSWVVKKQIITLRSLRLKLKYLVSLALLLLLLLKLSRIRCYVTYLVKKQTVMQTYHVLRLNTPTHLLCEMLNAKINEKELTDKSFISRFTDNSDSE